MLENDTNFDDLAERFISRVHQSEKGLLRRRIIERDLRKTFPYFYEDQRQSDANVALSVCDIGAGAGYFSILAAQNKHQVISCELSQKLLKLAQAEAANADLDKIINWHHGPFQALQCEAQDLIFCHGVIEWLSNPDDLFVFLNKHLKKKGLLSLCFYNPDAAIFSNLLKGNFHRAEQFLEADSSVMPAPTRAKVKPDKYSLTPRTPRSILWVQQRFQQHNLELVAASGIRVFSDYTKVTKGGLAHSDSRHAMELAMSDQESFWRLGRYVHLVAVKNE